MKDEKFWKIADEYEVIDKYNCPYVPRQNYRILAEAIAKANYGDYEETVADLNEFRYSSKALPIVPPICLKIAKIVCKKIQEYLKVKGEY